jgi:hypothetical protein
MLRTINKLKICTQFDLLNIIYHTAYKFLTKSICTKLISQIVSLIDPLRPIMKMGNFDTYQNSAKRYVYMSIELVIRISIPNSK